MIKSIILKLKDMIRRYGLYSTVLIIYYKLMQNRRNRQTKKLLNTSPDELKLQEARSFEKNILLSIVTPVYNTNSTHLREMLNSCINQTYKNWELILVDGSTSNTPETICKEYHAKYPANIRYYKLEKNIGISGNTNEALKYAGGEYIVLLDHDDILHPSALYECMDAIEKSHPDFIYTDMVSFIGNTKNLFHYNFKPDFALYTLRSLNYICHLAAFKTELCKSVGEFKSRYDSAQDYDIFLRLIEACFHVHHIPKMLYYWRAHDNSMSFNINSKPETLNAAIDVISDHYKRLGISAEVSNSSIPTTFKTVFVYDRKPMVSIIITVMKNCDISLIINNIKEHTNYENYEIIIATNCNLNNSEKSSVKIFKLDTDKKTALINSAVKHSEGEYLLVMCQYISLTDNESIENMLNYAMREDVGAVMVKILDNDNKLYSAGMGVDKVKGVINYHAGTKKRFLQFVRVLTYAHNISAVSSRFYMISKTLYLKYDGLDERYSNSMHSADLSLKLLAGGYNNIFTPYSTVNFYGKAEHLQKDIETFKITWAKEIEEGDSNYKTLTD